MRARLKDTYTVGGATPLAPSKWHDALRLSGDPRMYEVNISGKQVLVPADLVEERSVPDDAWENLGFGPLPPREPGQPTLMAKNRLECPEGHRIRVPPESKYTARSTLPCPDCGRSYTANFD